MTLLTLLSFLLRSLTVTLIILLFRIYLIILVLVFVLQYLSLHWKNSNHIDHQTQKWMPFFIAQLMTILLLIGTVFVII